MNRRPSPFAPASPLEDENLLEQILLRLPPQPSYLPCAALVCRSWRDILLTPNFLSRFRKHHRKPPLLGLFDYDGRAARSFFPILDRPNPIPQVVGFPLPRNFLDRPGLISFLGCRDGVALLVYGRPNIKEAILWDPLTGVHDPTTSVHRIVAIPPSDGEGMSSCFWSAAVRFSAPRIQHVDDNCQLSPFNLVLAGIDPRYKRAFTCIYESKSGVWGDITSTMIPPDMFAPMIVYQRPSILVGDALHWMLCGGGILEFDLQRQTLAVIKMPDTREIFDPFNSCQLLREKDNSLGLAVLSAKPFHWEETVHLQLWARKSNCDGVLSWALQKDVQLGELFSQPVNNRRMVQMMGYDEDTNI